MIKMNLFDFYAIFFDFSAVRPIKNTMRNYDTAS